MGIFTQAGPYYNHPYKFESKGDTPTPDELDFAIAKAREYDYIVRERERAAGKERPSDAPTLGIGMGLGPLIGGVARGTAGIAQGALGVASPIIPQFIEEPTARALSSFAESGTPQTLDQPGFGYQLAETVGGMVPVVGTSILAGLATLPAGGSGGFATAAGLSGLQGAGEAYERARAKGAEDTLAGYGAVLGGGAVGATVGALPVGRMLRPLAASPVTSKLVTKMPGLRRTIESYPSIVKSAALRAQRALRTGGEEAVSEVIENTLQNLMAMGYDPESEPFAGTQEAATMGGAAGAALQILADLIVPGRLRASHPGLPAPDTSGPPPGEPVPNTAVDVYDTAGRHRQAYEDASAAHASALERVKKAQATRNKARAAHANNPTEATSSALDQAAAELTDAIAAATTYEQAASSALSAMENAAAQARKQGQNIRPVTGLLPAPTAPAEPDVNVLEQDRAIEVGGPPRVDYREELLARQAPARQAYDQFDADQAAETAARQREALASKRQKFEAKQARGKTKPIIPVKDRATSEVQNAKIDVGEAELRLDEARRARNKRATTHWSERLAAAKAKLADATKKYEAAFGPLTEPTVPVQDTPPPAQAPTLPARDTNLINLAKTVTKPRAADAKAALDAVGISNASSSGAKKLLGALKGYDAANPGTHGPAIKSLLDGVKTRILQGNKPALAAHRPYMRAAFDAIGQIKEDSGRLPGDQDAVLDAFGPVDTTSPEAQRLLRHHLDFEGTRPETPDAYTAEPDVTTPEDKARILDAIQAGESGGPSSRQDAAIAASKTLRAYPNPTTALRKILEGADNKAKRWVESNIDAATLEGLSQPTPEQTPRKHPTAKKATPTPLESQATETKATRAATVAGENPIQAKQRKNTANALDGKTDPTLIGHLRGNNVIGAVEAILARPEVKNALGLTSVVRLALGLLKKAGDNAPTVVVVDNAPFRGKYDPATRTITLDSETGMNAHTVLHEVMHWATRHVLAKPDAERTVNERAAVKQLQETLDLVKEDPDLAHEAQIATLNLDEFVTELVSNNKVRDAVARLVEPGTEKPRGLFDKLRNALGRLLGYNYGPDAARSANFYNAVEAIMAQDPGDIYAQALYQMNNVADYAAQGALKPTQMSSFAPTGGGRGTVAGKITDAVKNDLGSALRNGVGLLTPLNPIIQLARKFKIPHADKVSALINGFESAIQRRYAPIDYVAGKILELKAKNPAEYKLLSQYKTDDSHNTTDRSISEKQAAKRYGRDSKRFALWQKTSQEYAKLSTDAKKLYRQTLAINEQLFAAYKTRVESDMRESLAGDADTLATVQGYIDKMMDFEKLEAYSRLSRARGKYFLSAQVRHMDARDGTISREEVLQTFDTQAAMLAGKLELQARAKEQGFQIVGDIETMTRSDMETRAYSGRLGGTEFALVMKKLDEAILRYAKKNPTKSAEIDAFKQNFAKSMIDFLPETSLMKALSKRGGEEGRGVLGADAENLYEAFTESTYPLARNIEVARVRNAARRISDDLLDLIRVRPGARALASGERLVEREGKFAREKAPMERSIVEELLKRLNNLTAIDPRRDTLARTLNTTSFFWMLTNPSTWLLSYATLPTTTISVLGGKYGVAKSAVAIQRGLGIFANSYFGVGTHTIQVPTGVPGEYETITRKSEPSLDNYFTLNDEGAYVLRDDLGPLFKAHPKLKARLQNLGPLVKAMADNGRFRRSVWMESVQETPTGKTPIGKVASFLAFPFHVSEQVPSQVTSIAAYTLALQKLTADNSGADPAKLQEKAAQLAIQDTLEVNGGSGIHTAPRLAQKGFGRTAMLFKNWTLIQAALQVRMAADTYRYIKHKVGLGELPPAELEAARVGMKQLMLLHASTGMLAGAVGMPLYGLIERLYDMLASDDENEFDTVAKNFLGNNDVLHKGVLTLLGVDAANRISLSFPDLIMRDNPYLEGQPLSEHVLSHVLGPSWSLVKQGQQGMKDFSSGQWGRGFENISPTAIRNLIKTARYYREGGANTRTGSPIYDDFTGYELFAQALGFTPAAYTRVQEATQQTAKIDRAIGARRNKLLDRYALELRRGSYAGVAHTLEQIARFNQDHPEAAITDDTLSRSMKSRESREMEKTHGLSVTYKDELDRMSAMDQDALSFLDLINSASDF